MDDERTNEELEGVDLPDDPVEDLEVEDEDSEDVSGGKWSDKW
jgi:hypothetical protein